MARLAPEALKVSRVRSPTILLALALACGARADDPPGGAALSSELIDRLVERAQAARSVTPSPMSDDAAFLRRLWLDVAGTLPTPSEVERFLADPDPGKRQRAIAAALAAPEAGTHAAGQWTAELFEGPARDGGAALIRGVFRDWLANELRRDRPWDQLAAELLAAEGRTDKDPALFWVLEKAGTADPADVAGPALRQLLGLKLECARCHDHPFQRWTQAEFHAAASWFARLRVRPVPGAVAVYTVGEAPVGEHRAAMGATAKVEVAPALPRQGGSELRPGAAPEGATKSSRRATFARWATSPENPWFARATVNRVWARLFGRGLVEPVDDLEAGAEGAPLGPVLDQLGRAFAKDGFSLRRLQAAILGSRAWQRSSRRPEGRTDFAAARELCATARVRPLEAPALAAALLRAAGRDRPGPGEPERIHQALVERLRAELQGAVPLPGAGARDPDQVTTSQALVTLVGPAVTGLVRGPLTDRVLAAGSGREARLRELWLRLLSRAPRPDERVRARKHLEGQGDSRAAWEDLAWALVAGSEFHANH